MQRTSSGDLSDRVCGYFLRLLEKSVEQAHDLPLDPACDLDAERAYLRRRVEQLRANLAQQSFGDEIKADAKELVGSKAGLDAIQYACTLVARAKMENMRILEAQLAGRYDQIAPRDPFFAGLKATGSTILAGDPGAPAFEGTSLNAAIERFYEFHAKHWARKTAADEKRVMGLVSMLLDPEKPIRSVAVNDVKVVRDALAKLPPNYAKLGANKGRELKEIIAGATSENCLSLKTQDKYFTMFRQFLIWAENEGYIDKVPGRGVKVAGVGKTNPADQRDPYSEEQLRTIFNSPLYRGHQSERTRHKPGKCIVRDGKYWAPLIALFSGMRMGEIVQLLKSDIREDGGIWYFDVNERDGKQLKTSSSKRRVPVHRILIDAGFLKFVQSVKNGTRIFSDIEPGRDGYYSHNFSKWWGRYSTQVGFKSSKTAFHSFRHCFRDALSAAEVQESHSKTLMGHADRGVHNSYGSGPSLKSLKTAVDKIEYGIELLILVA